MSLGVLFVCFSLSGFFLLLIHIHFCLSFFQVPLQRSFDLFLKHSKVFFKHDYAIFKDMKEISSILPQNFTYRLWIGLYDAVDSWKWSDPQNGVKVGDYRPWQAGLPDNVGGMESCGAISRDGYWRDYTCTSLLPFLCFNGDYRDDPCYRL
uniref:C-type lectin domain-containing protein n=1 Tax=Oryzias latipes TaxID=8090 RepID=A0A3P9LSS0_ORYLA